MDCHSLINDIVTTAEAFGLHGLSYQHITLCPTRAWLHYNRIDCAHLNRHMRMGTVLHERLKDSPPEMGVPADKIDTASHTIREIKKSPSNETASVSQLAFYIAVMTRSTGESWRGQIHYTTMRKTKSVKLDNVLIKQLYESTCRLKALVQKPCPPRPRKISLCKDCSYRIICWQRDTLEQDE